MVNVVADLASALAYNAFYNGITQNFGVRTALVGGYLISSGLELLNPREANLPPSSRCEAFCDCLDRVVGVAGIAFGSLLLCTGAYIFLQDGWYVVDSMLGTASIVGSPSTFAFWECNESEKPGAPARCLESEEANIRKLFNNETLTFEPEDPRGKVLILQSAADKAVYSQSLSFELPNKPLPKTVMDLVYTVNATDFVTNVYSRDTIGELDERFDVKFKAVSTPLQICHEINQGAKEAGRSLIGTVIRAHGSPEAISLGLPNNRNNLWGLFDPHIPSDCFDGIAADGKIVLHSCSTGSDRTSPSFAESLAILSGREVLASTEVIYSHSAFPGEKNGNLDYQFMQLHPSEIQVYKMHNRLIEKTCPSKVTSLTRRFAPTALTTYSVSSAVFPYIRSQLILGALTAWGVARAASFALTMSGKGLEKLSNLKIVQCANPLLKDTGRILKKTGQIIGKAMDSFVSIFTRCIQPRQV